MVTGRTRYVNRDSTDMGHGMVRVSERAIKVTRCAVRGATVTPMPTTASTSASHEICDDPRAIRTAAMTTNTATPRPNT